MDIDKDFVVSYEFMELAYNWLDEGDYNFYCEGLKDIMADVADYGYLHGIELAAIVSSGIFEPKLESFYDQKYPIWDLVNDVETEKDRALMLRMQAWFASWLMQGALTLAWIQLESKQIS